MAVRIDAREIVGTRVFEDGVLLVTERNCFGGTLSLNGFGKLRIKMTTESYCFVIDRGSHLVGILEPSEWDAGQRTVEPCKRKGLGSHAHLPLEDATFFPTTNKSRFLLGVLRKLTANQGVGNMEEGREMIIVEQLQREEVEKALERIGVPAEDLRKITLAIVECFCSI